MNSPKISIAQTATLRFRIRLPAVPLAICAVCFLFSFVVQAQNSGVWTGSGGDGLWTGDANNWAGSTIASGSGETADFSQYDFTGAQAVHVDTTVTIGDVILGTTDTGTPVQWSVDNNSISGNTLTLATSSGTPTITVSDPDALGNSANITTVLAGTQGLNVNGAGILILSNANTFTGGLTVQQGTLVFGINNAWGGTPKSTPFTLGSSSGGSASMLLPGNASLHLTNEVLLGTGAVGPLTLGNYTNITGSDEQAFLGGVALNGNNLTVQCLSGSKGIYFEDAAISGSGNVLFNFSGASSYIEVESSAGINNSGSITVQGTSANATGGSPPFLISTIGANVTAINFNSSSLTNGQFQSIAMGTGGKVINSNSTQPLTAASTHAQLGAITGTGPLTLNCNSSGNLAPYWKTNTFAGNITNSGTGTGVTTINCDIHGAYNVVQNSASSPLILCGTNNFTSPTLVESGTLLWNTPYGGFLNEGGSRITVFSGGTLDGNGIIPSLLTVNAGGTLAPGTNDGFTIGTLTLTNNGSTLPGGLSLNGNLFFKLNPGLTQSNDYVNLASATDTLTNLGTGTLTVTNVGSNPLYAGETFQLFSQPLIGGNTLTITGGGASFINNLAVNGSIQVSGGAPPPSVTSLVPNTGSTNGGTLVTVNGANFQSGATVQFGSTTPITATFVSSAELTVTTPAQPAGTVTVTVENPDTQTTTSSYTYILPPPPATISSLTESAGSLTFVWQGGTNQSCVLLSTTNVALPTVDWTPVTTNTVGASGMSTNTISVNPSQPHQFYLLDIPYN